MPFELLLNLALLEVCLIAYFKNRVYLEIDIIIHKYVSYPGYQIPLFVAKDEPLIL